MIFKFCFTMIGFYWSWKKLNFVTISFCMMISNSVLHWRTVFICKEKTNFYTKVRTCSNDQGDFCIRIPPMAGVSTSIQLKEHNKWSSPENIFSSQEKTVQIYIMRWWPAGKQKKNWKKLLMRIISCSQGYKVIIAR